MSELIRILPAIALRGTTILPDMIVHFDVSRSRSVKAVEAAMLQEQKVFLVTQKDPDTEVPGLLDVYKIGTVPTVKQVVKLPKGVLRILVEGEKRAELLGFEPNDEWLEAEIEGFDHLEEKPLTENEQEAMSRNLKELFTIYCRSGQKISQELAVQIMENESLERLVDQIAINLPIDYEQRQKLLEAVALTERYELLCTILANEVEIMEIRLELQSRIKERIDKNQKEYILREQLRLIREELGEDNVQSEIEGYRKAAAALKASKEVKEKINEEIRRFENVGGNPSEGAVIRGYIETLLGLPWDKTSRDNQNLAKAREILEAEPAANPNSIVLTGYICKPPVYRTTPFNREIADLLLAVNRAYNKSDYIPCIAWGRNARFVQNLKVGDRVALSGRIQSREYVKRLSESEQVTMTAYEVSVSKLAAFDEDAGFDLEREFDLYAPSVHTGQ